MEISKTKLEGLYIVRIEKFSDARGYNLSMFQEADYLNKIMEATGQKIMFVENLLSSSRKGVLRGMHYDDKRWKLCQCLSGKIFYVAVDVKTKQYESVILSAFEPIQVLKAPHLAHGFQVMTPEALFFYMTSEFRDEKREKVYPWNGYSIPWPVSPPVLSDKDRVANG
jgi:dTDP-4-dehydrorhamnose 3,5-epimerase